MYLNKSNKLKQFVEIFLISAFLGTGKDSTRLFLFPSLGQTIDLLGALGLYNNSWVGVTLTYGATRQIRPAYLLQGNYFHINLCQLC